MIALVDCNACYASCEQIYRPDLRGKPVVVLSNNDGCIVTRNAEAKALNIPNLEPYFKIKDLLEQHHVHVFSSNYELYGDTSARIMSLLAGFGVEMEVYSVDEAFLNVAGHPDLLEHGDRIKKACWQQQRMPVCVGISKTKTLSKMANHIAKKSKRLDGVCLIDDPLPWRGVFKKLPVNEVWGVGRQIHKRLALIGIHSVQDLIDQSPKRMRRYFGVTLERTVRELQGEACMELEMQPDPKKEIFCSRSFSQKITSSQQLQESVANYAVRAAEKLRRQKSLTRRVYVMLKTSRFKKPYYSNSAGTGLLHPTNDSREIARAATRLCQQLYRPGYGFARAGVGLLDLSGDEHYQEDLFTKGQSKRSLSTMAVLDQLNSRYGKGSVFLGSQGVQRKWSMSRNMKSPAYSTRFSDIPIVKL